MCDELVKRLRYCSEEQNGCGMCALSSDCVLRVGLLTQAADAIEELSKRVPPVPHGRLIDADAFFDDLLFPSKQFEQGMRELIGDAPTVIPAEEVYDKYTDTAGNLHWTGTQSGKHIIPAEEEPNGRAQM